jgi:nucleotide-binding universal stress UspA family protein
MKTILLPCEMHDYIDSTLRTACLFGSLFDSYIEGFPLRPVIPALAADGIAVPIVYETIADPDAGAKARQRFEATMREAYAPLPGSSRSAAWVEDASVGDVFVGSYGRVFDVTVVGRPGVTAHSPRMATLESALFESGRPILIAPPSAPQKLGETVVVGWNKSTETARALALSLPLLRRAKGVTVVSLERVSTTGPSGEQVGTYLGRHGIACEVVPIDVPPRSNGEAILSECKRLGADLLIKGAFTQSRLRQFIFGGATQHIIAEAEIPVFMAH